MKHIMSLYFLHHFSFSSRIRHKNEGCLSNYVVLKIFKFYVGYRKNHLCENPVDVELNEEPFQ